MLGHRILVLGCPGSGKTTLAVKLGTLSGLPVVHLDKLFWKPGWVQSPREEFYAALLLELQKDAWIMDGNFNSSISRRLEYCDMVIYFDYPRLVCIWGVLTRVLKAYGRTRPDMGEGCPEHFDRDFIKLIWNFEKTQGTKNKELVKNSAKPVIWLRSRREVRRFLEEASEKIVNNGY
jgi:adenylate kinase family enzyme